MRLHLINNWNKYQVGWFLEYFSKINNSTKVGLLILNDWTKTLRKLNSCLLKLTITKITLMNVYQTVNKDEIEDCFLNRFLIKLISSPNLTEISLPGGEHLRNLDLVTKNELCQCLQYHKVQSLCIENKIIPFINSLEIKY